MSPWRPGQHAARLALEEPFEDVPQHLFEPLWHWFVKSIPSELALSAIVVKLRLVGLPDAGSGGNCYGQVVNALRADSETDGPFLLDLVETLLKLCTVDGMQLALLMSLLDNANSAYRLASDGRGLEMRLAPGVKETVQETVRSAIGSAGEHLTNAWNAAYGLTSDPVKAYSEAIKAVESAAAPVLTPNDLKATLGTLRGHLKGNIAHWTFVVGGDIETVLKSMSALWDNQTSRHGGVNPTRNETPEEARAAVHLAAALVQWFVSGAVTKK